MPRPEKTVVVTDPRSYDGDPFAVADRAIAQCIGLNTLSKQAVEDAILMARNAEMERQCLAGIEPDAELWLNTVQGRRWHYLWQVLAEQGSTFKALQRAAAYDPKNPSK